jgi:hypothetical protein
MKNFFNHWHRRHDVPNFALPDFPVALTAVPLYGEDSISMRIRPTSVRGYLTPCFRSADYLDQLAPPFNAIRTGNADKRLLERLLLPDVLRLDLNRPSSVMPALPGAQGVEQRRQRPRCSPIRIAERASHRRRRDGHRARLGRELADVAYTPAGEAIPGRRALRCQSAAFPATPPSVCSDARVTAVLQGTDFIEPDTAPSIGDPLGAINNTADSGNDRMLNTEFPFFASQHPVPGEAGEDTTGFPRSSDPAIIVFGGRANDNQVNR